MARPDRGGILHIHPSRKRRPVSKKRNRPGTPLNPLQRARTKWRREMGHGLAWRKGGYCWRGRQTAARELSFHAAHETRKNVGEVWSGGKTGRQIHNDIVGRKRSELGRNQGSEPNFCTPIRVRLKPKSSRRDIHGAHTFLRRCHALRSPQARGKGRAENDPGTVSTGLSKEKRCAERSSSKAIVKSNVQRLKGL